MKNFSVLFAFSILFSTSAMAKEKCYLQPQFGSRNSLGMMIHVYNIGDPFVLETDDWQDCFTAAVDRAASLPYRKLVKVSPTLADVYYIFIKWSFNDGYVFDSGGRVNSNTDDSDVQQGDRRVHNSGSLF